MFIWGGISIGEKCILGKLAGEESNPDVVNIAIEILENKIKKASKNNKKTNHWKGKMCIKNINMLFDRVYLIIYNQKCKIY